MAPRDDVVELLQALAVTAELTGTELSEAAARVMADDLAAFPLRQVLGALTRCRRELKGRLTVAAIVERLDDGRPGPNEAWAMIPQDESGSVVWTSEMAEAYGVAAPLLAEGQVIAARSAFIEAYAANVTRARAEQRTPHWFPSLGHDPLTRAAALDDAVRKGRLAVDHAQSLLPAPDKAASDHALQQLSGPRSQMPEEARAKLLAFRAKAKQ